MVYRRESIRVDSSHQTAHRPQSGHRRGWLKKEPFMNDREPNRAQAIHAIASLFATAYLRLRFPNSQQKAVDCAENARPHVAG